MIRTLAGKADSSQIEYAAKSCVSSKQEGSKAAIAEYNHNARTEYRINTDKLKQILRISNTFKT
jgi:hypothetical protein